MRIYFFLTTLVTFANLCVLKSSIIQSTEIAPFFMEINSTTSTEFDLNDYFEDCPTIDW